jgi:hypothetical protein
MLLIVGAAGLSERAAKDGQTAAPLLFACCRRFSKKTHTKK